MRLFILFQLYWLNIFLPAHARGAYGTLPGAEPEGESCCATRDKSSKPEQAPSGESQKRNCVICHFAKGYTTATTVTFDLRPAGRPVSKLCHVEPQVQRVACLLPYFAHAPPTR